MMRFTRLRGTYVVALLLGLFACRDNEFNFESAESVRRCEKQDAQPLKVREGIAESVRLNYSTYGIEKVTGVSTTGNVGVIATDLTYRSWSDVLLYGKARGAGNLVVSALDDDGNTMTINLAVQVVGQDEVLPPSDSPSCTDGGTTEADAGLDDGGTTKDDASSPKDGGTD